MSAFSQRRSVAATALVVGAGVIMLFLADRYGRRRAPTPHASSSPADPRPNLLPEPLEARRLMAVTLQSSTYFGGNGEDVFRDAVVAPDGSIYLSGASFSTNLSLPTGGYDRTANGAGDSLVVRLAGDLSDILAGTLLGGSGWEKNTYGIGLDAQGNVYVTGETRSSDFVMTSGAVQGTFGGGESDAFVAKLDPSLAQLFYATYLGGSHIDAARGGLAVDPSSGQVTVVGWTGSSNFPTTSGSYQPTYRGGTYDGFVARLAPDGRSLVWSTLLGGSFGTQWFDSEYVVGATLGSDGSVYFTGSSTSSDFPTTPGAYDRTPGGNNKADAFVGRLSADGKALLWSTLLGGSDAEFTEHRVAQDAEGNIVIVGTTQSRDFPVTTGRSHGGGANDVFVAKISADGTRLLWSTLVGGSGGDSALGPVLGPGGDVYVAGETTSANFPVTADAQQKTQAGGQDSILLRLDGASGQLKYATYLGGAGDDYARYVTADRRGRIYVTGETRSTDFPTTANALQPTYGGGADDAFITQFYFDDDTGTGNPTPPELEVRQGTADVPDGAASPVSFGTVTRGAIAPELSFTISNTGEQDLVLGTLSLLNNAGFEIVTQPATTVAPGGSTTFVLRMLTGTVGSASAEVSFGTNDADEDPFNFLVAGTVAALPAEVRVLNGQQDVPDGGGAAPVSFGSVSVGSAAPELTFTIENTGGEPLTVGQIVVDNNAGFEVVRQPDATVAPGGSTSFVLRMLTTTAGAVSADVRFDTSDADENPFDFPIAGVVTAPSSLTINGTSGGDTVYVKRSASEVHVWVNIDPSPSTTPTHTAVLADLQSFTIATGDGNDHVTLDLSGGDPVPVSGLAIAADVGTDRFSVIGSDAADSISFDGSGLSLGGGGASVSTTSLESLEIIASGGADALAFSGNAVVSLAGVHVLASLALQGAAHVDLPAGAVPLSTQAIAIADQSVLDLRDSELIVVTTPETRDALLSALTAAVRSAREATPRWSGPGVTSTTAVTAPLTGLGVFSRSPDAASVVVKRVYNGDANGDGSVNADDYFRIDQGFLAQPANATYAQGDFNFDGRVNADDYFLIDQSFLGQSGAPAIASASRESAASSAAVEQTELKRSRTRLKRPVSLFNAARRVTRERR